MRVFKSDNEPTFLNRARYIANKNCVGFKPVSLEHTEKDI